MRMIHISVLVLSIVAVVVSGIWMLESDFEKEPIVVFLTGLAVLIYEITTGKYSARTDSTSSKGDKMRSENHNNLSIVVNAASASEPKKEKVFEEGTDATTSATNRERVIESMKKRLKILFIDDDSEFSVVKILKDAGWKNTKSVKDIRSLDLQIVQESDVYFVDINGVGKLMGCKHEGLDLAEMLKERYPAKKLVIYSATQTQQAFHRAWSMCDYRLEKNALPYQFQKLVENFAINLHSLMANYYKATDVEGELIFSTFPSEVVTDNLVPNDNRLVTITTSNGVEHGRVGIRKTHQGCLYIFTTEKKYVQSDRLFKELMSISIGSLSHLIEYRNRIRQEQDMLNEELVHNLTSLNTYSIQTLFALVPQEKLAGNINKQEELVKEIILAQPNVAASTLLKLVKNNLSMKVEFSVFDKSMRQYPQVKLLEDSIRSVILTILQIFIQDFDSRAITVFLAASDKRLNVDFESLTVSFYYILDNAVKYCCSGTDLKINFNERKDAFEVVLDMISIPIDPEDVGRLCDKGYRSKHAKEHSKDGSGIGMYRMKKTLKMNGAEIRVFPKASAFVRETKHGRFEHNRFIVAFPGQQDWFKANM